VSDRKRPLRPPSADPQWIIAILVVGAVLAGMLAARQDGQYFYEIWGLVGPTFTLIVGYYFGRQART
jgi:hypothetical protein